MAQTDLADIEAIEQLKARYFRLLDTKQWEAWGEVFAKDVVLDTDGAPAGDPGGRRAAPTLRGRDAVVGTISAAVKGALTIHHGHMPEIELTSPTTARGVWAMEDIVERQGGRLHGFGHYHETYTCADGRWCIQSLHLTRLKVDLEGGFRRVNEDGDG